MKINLFLLAIAGFMSLSKAEKISVTVGDKICVEGFVMDNYCIGIGFLLDAPEIKTLFQPEEHSLHCLVDPPICRDSGYEVLWETPDAATPYSRAYVLDEAGNQELIAFAQQTGEKGFCTSCTGPPGSQTHGFRATINGEVTDIGNKDTPASLLVSSIEASDVGCGDKIYEPPFLVAGSASTAETYRRSTLIHGSLMLIGWGWLLPSGAVIAKFGRHRDPLWFNIHKMLQVTGLVCSFAGWILALTQFDVFSFPGTKNYTHAVLGTLVMVMGLLQAVLGILRPHLPKGDGEEKSTLRRVWEIKHKIFGYGALILAVVTIGIGTTLLQRSDEARVFQITYGFGVGCLLILTVMLLLVDKKNLNKTEEENVDSKA